MIDNIENNVVTVDEIVIEGKTNLTEAVEKDKAARKV